MSSRKWQDVGIQTSDGIFMGKAPVIISASRATDIPALYPDWFLNRLDAGYIKWINRFNGRPMYVSLEKMRAIVFWTKNPEPLMKYLPIIDEKDIHYYFTFTLNDYEVEGIEPRVPPLVDRIDTFKRLSDTIGKNRVIWRFDPLILMGTMSVDQLLAKFYRLGKDIHTYTEKLVISFIDIHQYRKVRRNLSYAGFHDCREFTIEDMTDIAMGLQGMNSEWNLKLATCTETTDLSDFGISHNKCIDDELMIQLFNYDRELMTFLGCKEGELVPEKRRGGVLKDKGQRRHCRCVPSKDIGQYDTCMHGCFYCYANASPVIARKNFRLYKQKGCFRENIV